MSIFSEEIKNILPDLVGWRRYLHARPELSFEEFHTTAFLEEKLKEIPGLVLERPTRTGIVATLKGAYPGRCIAIRADIDALPIQEETDVPFASQTPGVMHACGHDGHTAMLLAAAKVLAGERDRLHGSVKFIFQHGEEVPPGGAAEMAAAGVLDGVDEVYGLHLSSQFPTGQFGIRTGALTSATDRFDVVIKGKGGHSAFPETCVDPILIASQVIVGLQAIVSRQTAAVEPAVLSVCMIGAGSAYNIIPGEVSFTGSTRTFSRETRASLPGRMEAIVKGICDAYGASYDFTFTYGYASIINDPELTEAGRKAVIAAFGEDHTFPIHPLMPGEDFSAFSDIRPGFFVELGAGSAEGCQVPHHNGRYRMDEDALGYGAEYFCQLVRMRLGSEEAGSLAMKEKEHTLSETWAQDALSELEESIEAQGVYIRQ